MTSMPSAFICLNMASMAMVVEARTSVAILDSSFNGISPLSYQILPYYMPQLAKLQALIQNSHNYEIFLGKMQNGVHPNRMDLPSVGLLSAEHRCTMTRTITVLSTRLMTSSRAKLMLTMVKII